MASSPRRADQGGYTTTRDLKWSHAEKTIARRAFTRALEREFEVVIREAKEMAGKIEQPSDLWDLESYLTQKPQGDRPQIRLPVLGSHARLGEAYPRRPPPRGRVAWPGRGQDRIHPLLRQSLGSLGHCGLKQDRVA